MNNFPPIKFGKCERCGRTGLDEDGNALTGYYLTYYQGQWLDQLCINELEDIAHDEISRERILEEESFRESAGYIT